MRTRSTFHDELLHGIFAQRVRLRKQAIHITETLLFLASYLEDSDHFTLLESVWHEAVFSTERVLLTQKPHLRFYIGDAGLRDPRIPNCHIIHDNIINSHRVHHN